MERVINFISFPKRFSFIQSCRLLLWRLRFGNTNRANSLYCTQLASLNKIGCASEEQFQASLIVFHSACSIFVNPKVCVYGKKYG